MNIIEIRNKIQADVFSSEALASCLSGYSNPEAKNAYLAKTGQIIRIRRGLYAFPEALRREAISPCVLANRIYGPSYVSEDYALSHYGMIPESTPVVTSIAYGRSREFATVFGRFDYRYCRSKSYSAGVTLEGDGQNRYMIATPEKALFDKVLYDVRFDGNDVEEYLLQDLRIDEESLSALNKERIDELKEFMVGRLAKLYLFLRKL